MICFLPAPWWCHLSLHHKSQSSIHSLLFPFSSNSTCRTLHSLDSCLSYFHYFSKFEAFEIVFWNLWRAHSFHFSDHLGNYLRVLDFLFANHLRCSGLFLWKICPAYLKIGIFQCHSASRSESALLNMAFSWCSAMFFLPTDLLVFFIIPFLL